MSIAFARRCAALTVGVVVALRLLMPAWFEAFSTLLYRPLLAREPAADRREPFRSIPIVGSARPPAGAQTSVSSVSSASSTPMPR